MAINIPISDFANGVTLRHLTLSICPYNCLIGGIDLHLKSEHKMLSEHILCIGEDEKLQCICQKINKLLKFEAVTLEKIRETPFEQNIVEGIEVSVIYIGKMIIAIGNAEETEFLIKEDFDKNAYLNSTTFLSKKGLFDYIQINLMENAKKYMSDFSCKVALMHDYIASSKQYITNLSIEDRDKLLYYVKDLDELLNKKD